MVYFPLYIVECAHFLFADVVIPSLLSYEQNIPINIYWMNEWMNTYPKSIPG